MQYKVPQNIDMQDRIVGPLTMVQFIYAVIGGGICYSIFINVPKPFSIVLIAPIALFVICLDFVKINERPFINFFMSAISFASSPKQRVWHQGTGADLRVEIYKAQKQEAVVIQNKNISHQQIHELAQRVDHADNKLIKN